MSERAKFGFAIEEELTKAEHDLKMQEHLVACGEVEGIKAERALAMSGFKERLNVATKTEQALRAVCTSKVQRREIECYQERDDRRGMMLTMRFDNNAIVDERALTVDELNDSKQKELPFKEKAAPDAPPPDPDAEPAEDADLAGKLAEYEALGDDAPPVPELEDEDDDQAGDDEED